MSDPWELMLDTTPAAADVDPWAQWNVAWEDVSRPIDEAVQVIERVTPPDTQIDGHVCAVCSRPLRRDTWSLGIHEGRPALVHAGQYWRDCYQ